ncbi:Chromatin structure-remodeling complex subunit RSC9 [Leucoagaricus sp. SymC.cos]|nr:Chromatin structure-remodeling complex subunit RSC9 [Leucoagaricus sp. SymC.cos]
MTTFVNRNAASYYRPQQYTAPQPVQTVQRPAPDIRDDYERWYTETASNNRMSLSLRCGILGEVAWALDRLCRLCMNEQFMFRTIPGLIDGLFDWPEWYVTEGYKNWTEESILFSPSREFAQKRRHALESLFVMRNSALNETNSWDLALHTHTMPLILNSLFNLDANKDENVEFVLYILDIFQVLAPRMIIHTNLPPSQNPLPPIINILRMTTNRSMIISSLMALTILFSNPSNTSQLTTDSPALAAAIRYLPLFSDIPLVDACLNYLYVQISHPAFARAFLLHPGMPSVLKLLASFILQEQVLVEESVSLDVTGSVHTVASTATHTKDHELTQEELDKLLELTEPQRCYDWMKCMFVAKTDGEMTQVDFWNLYKDTFNPYAEKFALLVASDVIKNVNHVFPQAQAMVLQGQVQRFIVRGVDRRKDATIVERCKHPSQSDTITLPSSSSNYPVADPTTRPIPPLRSTVINYTRPKADPPSPALTALLILRILYRTSFASADAAPRADAGHFGFPGIVEDTSDPDDGSDTNFSGEDKEGEMRGRKAFVGTRKFLENVNIYDPVLMSWVAEMADVGITGTNIIPPSP